MSASAGIPLPTPPFPAPAVDWGGWWRKIWRASWVKCRPGPDQLRLVSRLAVTHGSAVSVVEFASDRFLVATSTKGRILVLPLAAREVMAARSALREPGHEHEVDEVEAGRAKARPRPSRKTGNRPAAYEEAAL